MNTEQKLEKMMEIIIKLEKHNFLTSLNKEEIDFIIQQLNEDYIALQLKQALELEKG